MYKPGKFPLALFFAVIFFSLSTCAIAASAVFPAPSLSGATGLIRIPSADVIPYKNFNIGAAYGTTMSSSSEPVLKYAVNLGTFNGVELGITGGTEQGGRNIREGVFVNMKLSLSTGEEPSPMLLAIGVENLFSYTQTDLYMVATKYFKQGPKLTFGFMADFPNSKFRPLGMLGVETSLSDNLLISGDLMAGETLFQLNAGAKLYFTPIFSLNLYGINILDGQQAKDPREALLGFSWANPF